MSSYDERMALYELLRPLSSRLAYKLTEHLKALIKSSDHPEYIKRALRATDVILSFLDLSYNDYRTFAGNLNHIRRSLDRPDWGELIDLISALKAQMGDSRGLELAQLLGELTIAEAERTADKTDPDVASRSHQLRFIDDLLLMSRTLFPLGVNVIQPEWYVTGANESYFTLDHTALIQLSSNTSIMVSRDRGDQRCARLDVLYGLDHTRDEDSSCADSMTLTPGSMLSIGRGYLKSRSLFGFPISFRVDSDLKIDDHLCSRAALLCVLDQSGHLFIFDRASRNPVTCIAQSRRDPSSSLIYRYSPEVTSAFITAPSALSGRAESPALLSAAPLSSERESPSTSDSRARVPDTLVYNFGMVRREEITFNRPEVSEPRPDDHDSGRSEDTELSREPVSPLPRGLDLDLD